jgi:CBS domain-containing protein
VRDIMRRHHAVTARPDETVAAATARMTEQACGSILVCDGGKLVGIFTERDLVTRVVAQGLDPKKTELVKVMTSDPARIESTAAAHDALRRMDEIGCRYLPVLEDGRILGVISRRDIPIEIVHAMQPELEIRHAPPEGI